MFSQRDIDNLDRGYFEVLYATSFAITLRSGCTGHEWHLIAREGRGWTSCEVYHRHKQSDPWHRQWGGKTLDRAISAIKDHDKYQLNERRK